MADEERWGVTADQDKLRVDCFGWDATLRESTRIDTDVKSVLRRKIDIVDPKREKRRVRDAPPYLPDRDDPKVGKWAVVVPRAALEEAKKALSPLLELRRDKGMAFTATGNDPPPPGIIATDPLVTKDPQRWIKQIERAAGGKLPRYLLLAGGPDVYPFALEEALGFDYLPGRLDAHTDPTAPFSWEMCGAYAKKVVDYETGKAPVSRRVVLFSPAVDSATRKSQTGLIAPLRGTLSNEARWAALPFVPEVISLLSEKATTVELVQSLSKDHPVMVVTATHGYEAPYDRRLLGALTDATCKINSAERHYFSAERALAELASGKDLGVGAVMLSFACFSAGVPAKGAHALFSRNVNQVFPEGPYVSPLPRVLLAHARGPVAFIGHVDAATDTSFMDGPSPDPAAFNDFLGWALPASGTLGRAMQGFRERAWREATTLSARLGAVEGGESLTAQSVLDGFVRFHDARGYVLLGDPAIRVVKPALD